jgi:hypothetical protein
MKEMFCDKGVVMFSILLFFFAYEPGDSSIFEYQLLKVYKVVPSVLAIAQIMAYAMIMLSSVLFQKYCRKCNSIAIITNASIICLCVFVARNLFLTKRIELPINLFFITNVAIGTFFGHLSFLPLSVISTTLCKAGAEATMYAYFMALTNFASIVSRELSGIIASVIGIKKQLNVKLQKLDLFYGICITLDVIGIIVVFVLYFQVPVKTNERHEIELTEFDGELEFEDIIEADLENKGVPIDNFVDVDLN